MTGASGKWSRCGAPLEPRSPTRLRYSDLLAAMAESSYAATELTGVYARQLERQPVAECCGGHDDACARAFASCVEMAVAVFGRDSHGHGNDDAQTPPSHRGARRQLPSWQPTVGVLVS